MDSKDVKTVEAHVKKELVHKTHLEEHMNKVRGLSSHFETMYEKKKGYIKPTLYQ